VGTCLQRSRARAPDGAGLDLGRLVGGMILRVASVCLLAFVLAPSCKAAGTKAKTKDPWDVPDGSEEGVQAAPQGAMDGEGGGESEMAPEDQAGIMEQVAARGAARRAKNQHQVMKQFMSTFANNMRLSVLEDSKGDMSETRRQQLIAKAEAEKAASAGSPMGGEDDGPPPAEADGGEEMAPPPPRRRHMLNMAEARHQRMLQQQQQRMRQQQQQHRHRLLPEAEGIGFPAPEGMASDPTTDGMVNDPGSTSFSGAPAEEDEAPMPRRRREPPAEDDEAPAPVPRHQRHHVRMLNMRPQPGEHRKAHRRHTQASHAPTLPPGVVRDEMGRAMPLLFTGSKPAHSGATHAAHTPLAVAAIALLLLMPW